MTFKCLECGHIFEDGEQWIVKEYHTELDGSPAETFSYCPVCGGGYEEAHYCKKCYGSFLESELVSGLYCEECLRDSLTFESFLGFATTGVEKPTDVDTLEDFIFTKVFGLQYGPDESNESLKAWCKTIYNQVDKSVLMAGVFKYMDDISLWDDFADYLHGKEAKK